MLFSFKKNTPLKLSDITSLFALGQSATIAHEERLDYLNDVFGSMKQIKIWNNEKYFLSGFDKASQKWGSIYRQNLNIALLPRYLVETCILIGAVILIYFTFSSGINVSETNPPNRIIPVVPRTIIVKKAAKSCPIKL